MYGPQTKAAHTSLALIEMHPRLGKKYPELMRGVACSSKRMDSFTTHRKNDLILRYLRFTHYTHYSFGSVGKHKITVLTLTKLITLS